jgi:hypothetical protein
MYLMNAFLFCPIKKQDEPPNNVRFGSASVVCLVSFEHWLGLWQCCTWKSQRAWNVPFDCGQRIHGDANLNRRFQTSSLNYHQFLTYNPRNNNDCKYFARSLVQGVCANDQDYWWKSSGIRTESLDWNDVVRTVRYTYPNAGKNFQYEGNSVHWIVSSIAGDLQPLKIAVRVQDTGTINHRKSNVVHSTRTAPSMWGFNFSVSWLACCKQIPFWVTRLQ